MIIELRDTAYYQCRPEKQRDVVYINYNNEMSQLILIPHRHIIYFQLHLSIFGNISVIDI